MGRLTKRWDGTGTVCYQLAAAMQSASVDTELLYHPGDEDPSGVILTYRAGRKRFICLVSQPQSEQAARQFTPLVPLPFPED
jgi:hypothetical protein